MTSTPFDNHEALPWRAIKEPEWRAVLASTAALARSDTEDELLKEVCEAAVRAGGYLLAWYGRLVTNGIVTKPIVDAINEGWLSEYAFYYNNASRSLQMVGVDGDRTTLEKNNGYWFYTNQDNLALIVPGA